VPIPTPESPCAAAAAELVTETSAPWLVAHVWRTWHFGVSLIERRGLVCADTELAFVAAMLHDLGLTESYDGTDPFEETGAAGAVELASVHGWDPKRSALLATAIRRHLDLDAADDEPEIALVHLGAAADVVGLRLDEIADELIDRVLAEHARGDFARELRRAMDRQVEAKPTTKVAGLYRDFDFGGLIGVCPLDHR
jgi:HD superfamily phosphodiesterase